MVVVALPDPEAAAPKTPATQSQMQTHKTMGAMTQKRMKKKTLRPMARPRSTVYIYNKDSHTAERNAVYNLQVLSENLVAKDGKIS